MRTILSVVLIFALLATTAGASELSDYAWIVNNSNDARATSMLNNMIYHYGGVDAFDARIAYITSNPTPIVINTHVVNAASFGTPLILN